MLSPSTFLPSRLKMPTPTNGILTKGSVSDSHCHANASWQRAPRRPAWHANMKNSQWTSGLTWRAAHGSSSKSIMQLFSVSFTAQYSSDIQRLPSKVEMSCCFFWLLFCLFVAVFFLFRLQCKHNFLLPQFVLRNCLQFVNFNFFFICCLCCFPSSHKWVIKNSKTHQNRDEQGGLGQWCWPG